MDRKNMSAMSLHATLTKATTICTTPDCEQYNWGVGERYDNFKCQNFHTKSELEVLTKQRQDRILIRKEAERAAEEIAYQSKLNDQATKDADFYYNKYIELGSSIKESKLEFPDELMIIIRNYCCSKTFYNKLLAQFPNITSDGQCNMKEFIKCHNKQCSTKTEQLVLVGEGLCNYYCILCREVIHFSDYYLLSGSFSAPLNNFSTFVRLSCAGYYPVGGVFLHKHCAPLAGLALPTDNTKKYLRGDIKVVDEKGISVKTDTIACQIDNTVQNTVTWRLMDTPKSVCFTGDHKRQESGTVIGWNLDSVVDCNFHCLLCEVSHPWNCNCQDPIQYFCRYCHKVGHNGGCEDDC
jgi:hypothetical protein